MNRLDTLPVEIVNLIYEFDGTYREPYNQVVESMSIDKQIHKALHDNRRELKKQHSTLRYTERCHKLGLVMRNRFGRKIRVNLSYNGDFIRVVLPFDEVYFSLDLYNEYEQHVVAEIELAQYDVYNPNLTIELDYDESYSSFMLKMKCMIKYFMNNINKRY